MIKALNKAQAPFDAFYKTVAVKEKDNLFTYEKILKDLNCANERVLFLTSAKFAINSVQF